MQQAENTGTFDALHGRKQMVSWRLNSGGSNESSAPAHVQRGPTPIVKKFVLHDSVGYYTSLKTLNVRKTTRAPCLTYHAMSYSVRPAAHPSFNSVSAIRKFRRHGSRMLKVFPSFSAVASGSNDWM